MLAYLSVRIRHLLRSLLLLACNLTLHKNLCLFFWGERDREAGRGGLGKGQVTAPGCVKDGHEGEKVGDIVPLLSWSSQLGFADSFLLSFFPSAVLLPRDRLSDDLAVMNQVCSDDIAQYDHHPPAHSSTSCGGGRERRKGKVVSRQATPHSDTDRAVVVALAHEQRQKNWAGDLLRSHRSGHVG